MSNRIGFVAAMASAVLLAACDGSTIYKRGTLGDFDTLSIDAKQRLVISGTRRSDGIRVICAEPSPDALVAQAAVLSARGQYQAPTGGTTGGASANGSAGVGLQESAASIGIRTQSIQILRDGYYRLCEAYLNEAISTEEYRDVTLSLDTFINVALAIDGLGNSKSGPAVAIGTGPITVNGGTAAGAAAAEGGESAIGGTPNPAIVDAGKGGIDKDTTPAAVAQIVRDFLNFKEDYACIKYNHRTCRRLATGTILHHIVPPAP